MNAASSSPASLRASSVDRVRLIRRSIRCFIFGAIGVVPLLGLGMAGLALRLQRQVGEEAGEPEPRHLLNRNLIVAFVLAFILLCYEQSTLVLLEGMLLALVQAGALYREYHRTEPAEWNPARHLVYWGAVLAYAGLIMSATIIMLNLAAAFHHLGR